MKNILTLAAAAEAATGLALLVYPASVVHVLFGADILGPGLVISRIAGIALISLGIACGPGILFTNRVAKDLMGMLTYSLIVTLYLAYLGTVGEWVGFLLWPAFALHLIITCLLLFTTVKK